MCSVCVEEGGVVCVFVGGGAEGVCVCGGGVVCGCGGDVWGEG